MEWPSAQGSLIGCLKTPTTLMYGKDWKPYKWGWDAEGSKEEHPAGVIKFFKLHLLGLGARTGIVPDQIVPTPLPRGITIEQCIGDYLGFLRLFLLPKMAAQFGVHVDSMQRDIQWCLTVPAIWDGAAMEAMERAAVHAGMLHSAKFPVRRQLASM